MVVAPEGGVVQWCEPVVVWDDRQGLPRLQQPPRALRVTTNLRRRWDEVSRVRHIAWQCHCHGTWHDNDNDIAMRPSTLA